MTRVSLCLKNQQIKLIAAQTLQILATINQQNLKR